MHGLFIKKYFNIKSTMENNKPLILTIDFGTQSVRVSIFDDQGNSLAQEKQKYNPPYFSPQPGLAEKDPSSYFEDLAAASKRLIANNPELVPNLKGVVMSCFRDTAVYLDKDRNVIRPTILWLDQRYAKCEEKLPLLARCAFSLVGMSEVIRMNRRRTMMNWIKENEKENFEKIDKYVALSTYFIYRLTGELKDSPSDYTGHYPIDFKKGQFYPKPETHLQGQIFSIKKTQLCELVPGLSLLGKVTKEASELTGIPEGIEMYAAGSDKACETLGSGVIDENALAISLGTACTIETTMQRYVGPDKFLPAYPFVLPNYYNMDFQIYRGFWMINWFLKEFGAQNIEDLMNDEQGDPTIFNTQLHSVPPGSDGLLLQPYWGSQLDRPLVRGAIVGFSDATTRMHFYRALIEGISYELREAKERFEKNLKHPFTEIRIAGGGSKSDEVCQIVADILKLPVVRLQTNETSSLGAAMAGFLGIGHYKTAEEAAKAMVRKSETFTPDEKNKKVYDDLYANAYEKMYKNLKDIYAYLFKYYER